MQMNWNMKKKSSLVIKEDELLIPLIEKLSPSLIEKTIHFKWKLEKKKNVRLLGLYISIPHLSMAGKTIIVLKCYGLKLNPWVTK